MNSDKIYELAKEFQLRTYDSNTVVFRQVNYPIKYGV